MSAAVPSDKSYNAGSDYAQDLQAFSAKWRVDVAELRDALDEARHLMSLPIDGPNSKIRDELRRICEYGAPFADAIKSASDGSVALSGGP